MAPSLRAAELVPRLELGWGVASREQPLADSVSRYKALAHPTRLRVLVMLDGGALCVCQMTSVLQLAASTVSAHLSDLKRAGLLSERKDGRWVSYSWADRPELRRLRTELRQRLARDPEIRADARLLRAVRRVSLEKLCRVGLDLERLGIRAGSASASR